MSVRPARPGRRGILLRLVAIGACAAGSCAALALALETAPPGYYANQKVVYQNDGGGADDAAYFQRLLAYLHNHVQAVGRDHIEIRVVDHGPGIDLFTLANGDRGLSDRIDGLKVQGVRFLICANTLRERKVDWHDLYGVREDDIVPSGVAEIARLQGLGFVYLHP